MYITIDMGELALRRSPSPAVVIRARIACLNVLSPPAWLQLGGYAVHGGFIFWSFLFRLKPRCLREFEGSRRGTTQHTNTYYVLRLLTRARTSTSGRDAVKVD